METQRKTKKIKTHNRDGMAALFFLLPSLAGFAVFFLLPFLVGIFYSLVNNVFEYRFVGLDNYKELLSNPVFLRAASNTLAFTAVSVPLSMVLSLGLALLLNKRFYGRNWFRSFFITPLVVPVASVVFVWQVFFDINGSLNGLLAGMGFSAADWMKSGWARAVVVIVYLWKNTGYSMVLFLAGLQNIPAEYYEAAGIDGAGTWRKFRSITLVYLTPTTFFVFIMSIINSFKVFRETYLISGEYPHESIYMLQHYMNNMFFSLDYQKLTSAAFVMAVVIIAIVCLLFAVERKISRAIT